VLRGALYQAESNGLNKELLDDYHQQMRIRTIRTRSYFTKVHLLYVRDAKHYLDAKKAKEIKKIWRGLKKDAKILIQDLNARAENDAQELQQEAEEFNTIQINLFYIYLNPSEPNASHFV
jgi:hypothetical protein